MTTLRPHQSYRHEAFLYRDHRELLAGVLPFVREGVAAGQPVLVALPADTLPPVRDALGADAADVHMADMAEVGRNPAHLLPGLQRFIAEHGGPGRPLRCVGQPVWPGRRAAELAEAQLHEAVLNAALDPDTPIWLRCPYDAAELAPADLAEAARSHPILVEPDGYAGSRSYGGVQHLQDLYRAALPEPARPAETLALPATGSHVVALVGRHAAAASLSAEQAWSLDVVVRQVVAAVPTGATLRVWVEPAALVCEVRDPRPVDDPLAGPRPSGPDPRGLWLANRLCDLVQVRSTESGSTVRLLSWR